jgi:hypothetical protein
LDQLARSLPKQIGKRVSKFLSTCKINNFTLADSGVFLGWLNVVVTNNQPDTPLLFNSPNTRFSYNSRTAHHLPVVFTKS